MTQIICTFPFLIGIIFLGCSDHRLSKYQKISEEEAMNAIKGHVSNTSSDFDSDIYFEVEELDVKAMWELLSTQLFYVEYMLPDEDDPIEQKVFAYFDYELYSITDCVSDNGLNSAVVLKRELYFSTTCGSSKYRSRIGKLTIANGKIQVVESTDYPYQTLFLTSYKGNIEVDEGDEDDFNEWSDADFLGYVKNDGDTIVIVDEDGDLI